MEFFNSLNLTQIKGGTKLKQGDLGSVLSYSLTDENGQEITSFDTKTAYINLVLDDKIWFTTTTLVDISRVTFRIDKAIPIGLYYLEIKIDDYIFPSDRDSIILIEEGSTPYDLEELVPNYDINMTLKGILSDLSQKGIDITDLKTKMNAIYNNALADHAEITTARGSHPNLRSRLDEADKKQRQNTAQLAEKANKDEVTNVMTPKGNMAYASLPMTGNSVGWYYYCPDGDGTHGAGNYVWNGTSWYFGGTGDEGYNLLKEDLANIGIKHISESRWTNETVNIPSGVPVSSDTRICSALFDIENVSKVYVDSNNYIMSIFRYKSDETFLDILFDNVTEGIITESGFKYRVVVRHKDDSRITTAESKHFGYYNPLLIKDDNIFNQLVIKEIPNYSWTSATISGQTGNAINSDTRIASDFVTFSDASRICIQDPSDYIMSVFRYKSDETFLDILFDNVTEGIITESGFKYRVVVRHKDDSRITTAESKHFGYYNPCVFINDTIGQGLNNVGIKFNGIPRNLWKYSKINGANGEEIVSTDMIVTNYITLNRETNIFIKEPSKYLITIFKYGLDENYISMPFDNITSTTIPETAKYRILIKRTDGGKTKIDDGANLIYVTNGIKSYEDSSKTPTQIVLNSTTSELFEKLKTLALGEAKFNMNYVVPNLWPDGLHITKNDEHQVRHAMALSAGIAILLNTNIYDEEIIGVTKESAKSTIHNLIVSAANSHKENGGVWGDAWQSALWAFYLGEAYYLISSEFNDKEKESIKNCILHEADFACSIKTLYWKNKDGTENYPGDSKYEELLWWSSILQLALIIYPDAPNSSLYKSKIVTFGCIASAMPKDLNSDDVINGYKLSNLKGYNVSADGTVTNHGFIHPTYMVAGVFSGYAVIALNNYIGKSTILASVHNLEYIAKALYNADFSGKHIYQIGNREPYFPHPSDWGTDKVFDMPAFDIYIHHWGIDPFCDWSRWANLHLDKLIQMQSRQNTGTLYASQDEDLYGGDLYKRDTAVLQVLANTLLCLISPTIKFDTSDYINVN